jgi:hypothetical protein
VFLFPIPWIYGIIPEQNWDCSVFLEGTLDTPGQPPVLSPSESGAMTTTPNTSQYHAAGDCILWFLLDGNYSSDLITLPSAINILF